MSSLSTFDLNRAPSNGIFFSPGTPIVFSDVSCVKIPPTTAIMAWLFLNEKLNNLDLIGFAVATLGVYIATRKQ